MTQIALTERNAAKALDMQPKEFRALVKSGSLPGPIRIGQFERWRVDDIRAILSGNAARPNDDIEP